MFEIYQALQDLWLFVFINALLAFIIFLIIAKIVKRLRIVDKKAQLIKEQMKILQNSRNQEAHETEVLRNTVEDYLSVYGQIVDEVLELTGRDKDFRDKIIPILEEKGLLERLNILLKEEI